MLAADRRCPLPGRVALFREESFIGGPEHVPHLLELGLRFRDAQVLQPVQVGLEDRVDLAHGPAVVLDLAARRHVAAQLLADLAVGADPDDGPAPALELAVTIPVTCAGVAVGVDPPVSLDVDPGSGQREVKPIRADPELRLDLCGVVAERGELLRDRCLADVADVQPRSRAAWIAICRPCGCSESRSYLLTPSVLRPASPCNYGWPATLHDYDSLDAAAEHVPADIIARAAAELGETRVLWRDI